MLRESGLGTNEIEKIGISSNVNYPSGRIDAHTIVIDMQKLYDGFYSKMMRGA